MRSLGYDLPLGDEAPPVAGDIMVGPVAVYLVHEARPVESRVWANRWRITVERIGTRGDDASWTARLQLGARRHVFVPYRRGEGPTTPGRVGLR